MAGTLTISTLSDGTNSTSATNPIMGSAKAWVNFNGTTATPSTIRGSYNVTSVTKNGTGDYTINFTNAMANANYAITGTAAGTAFGIVFSPSDLTTARTTTSARVGTYSTAFNPLDCAVVSAVIQSS